MYTPSFVEIPDGGLKIPKNWLNWHGMTQYEINIAYSQFEEWKNKDACDYCFFRLLLLIIAKGNEVIKKRRIGDIEKMQSAPFL